MTQTNPGDNVSFQWTVPEPSERQARWLITVNYSLSTESIVVVSKEDVQINSQVNDKNIFMFFRDQLVVEQPQTMLHWHRHRAAETIVNIIGIYLIVPGELISGRNASTNNRRSLKALRLQMPPPAAHFHPPFIWPTFINELIIIFLFHYSL